MTSDSGGEREQGGDMELGLLIPQGYFSDFEGWEPRRAWERMVEIARLGEQLGFGSIWVGEHVAAKWHPEIVVFDGVTVMTALAALVPRVEIGFVVINSTFRHPAMTAKMASTLDVVSDSRVILGLGAGFKEVEAEWVGVEYPSAGSRLSMLGEHLEVISRMTRRDEPPVSFAGAHVRVMNAANAPRTGGRDHIPLLIGGHGKQVTFRLAARFADEVNLDVMPDALVEHRDVLHERCAEIGRDPSTIRVAAAINPCWPYRDVTVTGKQRMMEQHDVPSIMNMAVADAESRVAEITAWKDLGLDRLVCAAPGVADTDESLHELVDHLHLAGVGLGP
jgi:alkanesulfonate monooxygenase SsuD/methylene tetrahydromethanopterin reductase-like flavin-dependent oxidoreductase (luciferase family)